jgi:hypothetical protein
MNTLGVELLAEQKCNWQQPKPNEDAKSDDSA